MNSSKDRGETFLQKRSLGHSGFKASAQSKSISAQSSAPTQALLERLEYVKDAGLGRWVAKCPAHDDRSPSLSIREADDGRVLIRCFAGCNIESIVHAVGFELSDLFPRSGDYRPSKAATFNAREVFQTVLMESMILVLAYLAFARGDFLSSQDEERVKLSIQAIQNIGGLRKWG